MQILDINGIALRPGQRVVWASERDMERLMTGLVARILWEPHPLLLIDMGGAYVSMVLWRKNKFAVLSYHPEHDAESSGYSHNPGE